MLKRLLSPRYLHTKKGVQIPMARPGQPASQENAFFSAIPVEVEFKSEGNGAQEHSQQSKKKIDNIRLLGSFRKDSPSILHH